MKLKKIALRILPEKYHLFFIVWYLRLLGKLDPEMIFVTSLLTGKRRFLDIGANTGIYSYYFSKIFRHVEAFEPLSEITYRLDQISSESISVQNFAISDKDDQQNIYIPLVDGKPVPTLASLEKRDGEYLERNIPVKRIDSFNFCDVDLIKIDVEGHEKSVLLGAQETIRLWQPIMIIEIEQRHITFNMNEVFNVILDLDYEGFYLNNGQLMPISFFSYETHQAPYLRNVKNKNYINNFIFVPK